MIPDGVLERLVAAPGEGLTTLIEAGLLTPEHLEALLESASDLVGSNLETAGRLLDVIDEAVAVAGADALAPAVAYVRARALVTSGEPEGALAWIEVARQGYEGAAMVPAALRTDLGRMHVLDDLGRHDDAAAVGASLLETLATLAATPELERLKGAALGNLGVTLGFRGRHAEALAAYRMAEVAWRRLGETHQADTAVANQGIELLAMGQAGVALACLDSAIAHAPADGDQEWLGKCLAHRGSALSALGRYVEALRDYDRAGEVLASVGDGTELWRLSVETAATLLSLGLRQEATTVVAHVEGKLRDAGLHHDLASALAITGRAHLGMGSPELAKAPLVEAAGLYRAASDPSGHARALLDLSRATTGQETATIATDALALIEIERWPGVACLAYLRLAELAENDPLVARAYVHEARLLADTLQLPHLRIAVSQAQGALRRSLGDPQGAIEHFEEALALVDSIGTALPDEDLRVAYLRGSAAATRGLIEALLDRGAPADIERAARVADAAKGRTLVDVLHGALRPRTAGEDRLSIDLSGELHAAYCELFLADPAGREALQQRIKDLEQRVAVRAVLTSNGRSRLRPPGSTTAADVVPSVAYHVVGARVIAFVPRIDGTHAVCHVTDVARVAPLMEDLEGHLGRHATGVIARHGAARAAACQRILEELYLQIFAPVHHLLLDAGQLQANGRAPHLLVIPHGLLCRIPFHALHDGRQYLVERYRITVAPSLAASRLAAAQGRPAARAVIVGVGDDTVSQIEHEARGVAAALGDCTLLLGQDASVERVRGAVERASLVHFACHGVFRTENPAFSALRLADRWLRAADLADVALDGAILVLSACETARADAGDGDEAIGLARSFLAAGARCVVVSQWVADDRCTAELMTRFHHELAGGSDPATALRAAQLVTMKNYPHPFHWAPFIAVGAPGLPTEA